MPSVFRRRASDPASHDSASPEIVVAQTTVDRPSFRERGRLRRRLAFLRRTRELAFRDIGGLMFDLRRFGRDRPDLVEAKLAALAAVDQELRTLERVLDDRRPLHELHEPGITSCARCGALHASEANFCPHCGLQLAGPRAMGEVGGAIAAPPQPPVAPVAAAAAPAALATATVDSAPTQPFDAIAEADAVAEPDARAPDAAATQASEPASLGAVDPVPVAPAPEPAAGATPRSDGPEADAEQPTDTTRLRHDDRA